MFTRSSCSGLRHARATTLAIQTNACIRTITKQAGAVRVVSERVIAAGMDMAVTRLMENVENRVRKQPGLMEYETLVDSEDPTKFVVLTRWESKACLDDWLNDEWYIARCRKMDEVLGNKPSYRVFETPKEEIFLL